MDKIRSWYTRVEIHSPGEFTTWLYPLGIISYYLRISDIRSPSLVLRCGNDLLPDPAIHIVLKIYWNKDFYNWTPTKRISWNVNTTQNQRRRSNCPMNTSNVYDPSQNYRQYIRNDLIWKQESIFWFHLLIQINNFERNSPEKNVKRRIISILEYVTFIHSL